MADETMLTAAERAEIRERVDAATPGPWESPSLVSDMVFVSGLNAKIADCERVTDAKFIAAAREDVPRLLAFVEVALPILQSLARREVSIGRGDNWVCVFCEASISVEESLLHDAQIPHTSDCLYAQARALMDTSETWK